MSASDHPPIYPDEHGDWAAATRGAGRACGAPAPDRSGRSCDKPAGHEGDHWTYGGNTLTWQREPER